MRIHTCITLYIFSMYVLLYCSELINREKTDLRFHNFIVHTVIGNLQQMRVFIVNIICVLLVFVFKREHSESH